MVRGVVFLFIPSAVTVFTSRTAAPKWGPENSCKMCPGSRPQHDVRMRNKCVWAFRREKGSYQQKMFELQPGDLGNPSKTTWTSFWDPAVVPWPERDADRQGRVDSVQAGRRRSHPKAQMKEEDNGVACRRTVIVGPLRRLKETT